ncbi:hypothetical protein V1387_10400 [Allomuricauda taeanensis]|uniref:hypothetical protein n=1 Tax=Flagellimonas taeanensis TaxID=1005926 RepID=UPI002E7BE0DF|nr:hypothetical protein [Allomuricauda taeanensis]MEE1963094.1 hypothetical protein [Allomuricauda taeanensis]
MKNIQTKRYALGLVLFCLYCCNGIDDEVVDAEEIIVLKVVDSDGNDISGGTLAGDGETLVTLEVEIPEVADEKFREVTFSTTDGIFVDVGAKEHKKLVNINGIATTTLRVPLSNSPIFLSAEIGDGSDNFRSESLINLMGVDEVLTLQVFDEGGQQADMVYRADGETIVTLTATVNFNPNTLNQVVFESSDGTFLNASNNAVIKDINEQNMAKVGLRLPTTSGRIFFSAQVGNGPAYFDEKSLDLERAYPDKILIEPAMSSVDKGSSVTISVFLLRDVGKVSFETRADFEAFQLDDDNQEVSVGRFTGLVNATTDTDGKINVIFFADSPDIDVMQPIIIQVSSMDDSGNSISERITLEITQ